MKKCFKCDIVYEFDTRTHCLYCDTILVPANDEDQPSTIFSNVEEGPLLREIVRYREAANPDRQAYVVAMYFQNRSLPFMYTICRRELIMDRQFSRFWIEPMTMAYLISYVPWLIINVLDSILFRMLYRGYCEECNCKYIKVSAGKTGHSPEECEYNKEFAEVIFSILNGSILKNEGVFSQTAQARLDAGQKSAYHDLVAAKTGMQHTLDVASIWLSCGLIVCFVIWLIYPITLFIINSLE